MICIVVVRQNFDEEDLPSEEKSEKGTSPALEFVDGMRAEMQKYLGEVLRSRSQDELTNTREQILRCFDSIDCFMLPHPGPAVTKKNYDGNISKIEPFFRGLINYYVRYIFDHEIEAKIINRVAVTGPELFMYIKIYVSMFANEEDNAFPKAMTVLDATAEGNNRVAQERALDNYRKAMEKVAGTDCAYVKEEELALQHGAAYAAALKTFDDIATMGMPANIAKHRNALLAHLQEEHERFVQTNALRNPYKDVEYYILPLGVAFVAMILSRIVDWTCSNSVCERIEDTFENVYLFILFIVLVLAWTHVRGIIGYVKDFVWPLVMSQVEAKLEAQKKGK